MKTRRALAALAALGLLLFAPACAYYGPSKMQPSPERTSVVRRLAASMLGEISSLARASRFAETCPDVCRLSERICEAAAKICEIAASEPADRELSDRCGHAQTHCNVARDRCARCGK